MPPPTLKPETRRVLNASLLSLQPLLAEAEALVALRTQEFERARQQLQKAQFDLDTITEQRKALRQDLGEQP